MICDGVLQNDKLSVSNCNYHEKKECHREVNNNCESNDKDDEEGMPLPEAI